MDFAFWKMHGTGNDFVLTESDAADADWPALAVRVCDRHFGVGADGLIVALPSVIADRRMRIFNPDGSEAEMCGNGIRCFVKYLLDRGVIEAHDGVLRVETGAGVLEARATLDSAGKVARVRVGMGRPHFAPEDIGVASTATGGFLRLEAESGKDARTTGVAVLESTAKAVGKGLSMTLVSMGNPHAVQFIDDAPAAYNLETIGPAVEHDPLFTHRTNFEVVQVQDRGHMDMRVWERGAGMTLACGTGACAAVVAGRMHGFVDDDVEVGVPGGTLRISWDGKGEVYLEGPATRVFESRWEERP